MYMIYLLLLLCFVRHVIGPILKKQEHTELVMGISY